MRILDIIESTTPLLAWRIRFQRFKGIPPVIPERENKVYLMPMDPSAFNTFGSLTGKDNHKINNMPTEAYTVDGAAMVGDMLTVNFLLNAINDLKKHKKVWKAESIQDQEEYIETLKKKYVDQMVPYSQYQPGMFKMPEILADPGQIQKLNKSVTYNKDTGKIVFKDKPAIDNLVK